MALLKLAVLFATFLTVCANALPTLHAKGAKIFDSGGNQFFIKGTIQKNGYLNNLN